MPIDIPYYVAFTIGAIMYLLYFFGAKLWKNWIHIILAGASFAWLAYWVWVEFIK